MAFTQTNPNRLTQDELIEYVRMLISSGKAEEANPITNPIALKYLNILEMDANELESTQVHVLHDDQNRQLMEADRVRDHALSVFRRLMQVYELSEDNTPEAVAYEYLNELWTKKYDPLPFLSLMVETEGIDDLLFDLSADRYSRHLETLKLKEAVKKIKVANDAFKALCGDHPREQTMKPTYDARALRIELIETVTLYVNYVKMMTETSDTEGLQQLYKGIVATTTHFNELLAARHAGKQMETTAG